MVTKRALRTAVLVLVPAALAGVVRSQTLPSCPNDRAVCVNTRSGIYHFQDERHFGHTK